MDLSGRIDRHTRSYKKYLKKKQTNKNQEDNLLIH